MFHLFLDHNIVLIILLCSPCPTCHNDIIKSSASSYVGCVWCWSVVQFLTVTKILPLLSLGGNHPPTLSSSTIYHVTSYMFCKICKAMSIQILSVLTLKLFEQLLFKVRTQCAEFVVCDSQYHCLPVWLSIYTNRYCNLSNYHLTQTISIFPPLTAFIG